MDKQKISESVKSELVKIVDSITLENVTLRKDIVEKYLVFLEHLQNLPVIELPEVTSDEREVESPISSPSLESLVAEFEEEEAEAEFEAPLPNNVDRLDRKLKGGWLENLGVFVPEMVIRKLHLDHGDYVMVTPDKYKSYGDRKSYHYELYKKGLGIPHPNRIELRYCKVERKGPSLVVQYSFETGPLEDTFVLNYDDIERLRIEEDDIVDIAYMEPNLDYVVVPWKHPIEERSEITSKASVSKKVKDSEKSEELSDVDESDVSLVEPVLEGKSVLVVGMEPRHPAYKKAVEERGGTFDGAEGNEGKIRLTGMIKRADVVIIMKSYLSHKGYWDTVDLCKENNIPFSVVDNFGIISVINAAVNPSAMHIPNRIS